MEATDTPRPIAVVVFLSYVGTQFYMPGPQPVSNSFKRFNIRIPTTPPAAIMAESGNICQEDESHNPGYVDNMIWCEAGTVLENYNISCGPTHCCASLEEDYIILKPGYCKHGLKSATLYCPKHRAFTALHHSITPEDPCTNHELHTLSSSEVFIWYCTNCLRFEECYISPPIMCQAGVEDEFPITGKDVASTKARYYGPSDMPCSISHLQKRVGFVRKVTKASNHTIQPFAATWVNDKTPEIASTDIYGPLFVEFNFMFKYFRGGTRLALSLADNKETTIVATNLVANADFVGTLLDEATDYAFNAPVLSTKFNTVVNIPYRYPFCYAFTPNPCQYMYIKDSKIYSDIRFPITSSPSVIPEMAINLATITASDSNLIAAFASDDYQQMRFMGMPFITVKNIAATP